MLRFLLNKLVHFKKIIEYIFFFITSNIIIYILVNKNIYYNNFNELNVFVIILLITNLSNSDLNFSKMLKYVYISKYHIEVIYIINIFILYLFYILPVLLIYISINICILDNSISIDNLFLSYFLILLNIYIVNFITKNTNFSFIISLPLNLPVIIYYLYNNIIYNIYILIIYTVSYPFVIYYIFKKK